MGRIRTGRRLLLVALIAGAGACDSRTQTPTTPTQPTLITDTFDGSIGVSGGITFSFITASAGTVTATLQNVTPDSTVVVGLALGTWNGTTCQMVLTNDSATQGSSVTGVVSGAGGLCVRVYDTGHLVAVTNFQIVAVHP
jgi:hypothetical protein